MQPASAAPPGLKVAMVLSTTVKGSSPSRNSRGGRPLPEGSDEKQALSGFPKEDPGLRLAIIDNQWTA
jgi:hypothetical protein